MSFIYQDDTYYYTGNAQGDVTRIVDSDLNTAVEYSYDAWGKLLTTTDSRADTIGKLNPFLYRDYYYGAETGLYYLNSRYYNAQTGRLLNTDGELNLSSSLTDTGLFTYCGSNAINRMDFTGHPWLTAFQIFAVIVVASTVVFLVAPYQQQSGEVLPLLPLFIQQVLWS